MAVTISAGTAMSLAITRTQQRYLCCSLHAPSGRTALPTDTAHMLQLFAGLMNGTLMSYIHHPWTIHDIRVTSQCIEAHRKPSRAPHLKHALGLHAYCQAAWLGAGISEHTPGRKLVLLVHKASQSSLKRAIPVWFLSQLSCMGVSQVRRGWCGYCCTALETGIQVRFPHY